MLPFGTSAANSDAAADGRLSSALMLEHWAFAADLLTSTVSAEISVLFAQALGARFGDLTSTTHRSAADQVLDAIALEVASAQGEPLVPC